MDRKKKIKTVAAVCFVLVFGTGFLIVQQMGQRKRTPVLEKQSQMAEFAGEVKEPAGEGASGEAPDGEASDCEVPDGEASEGEALKKEEPEEIYVHLCGAVAAEGVYVLPKGSRLTDAITAAGGFAEYADTTYHNLAAGLFDGQRVYVPNREETKGLSVSDRAEAATGQEETLTLGKTTGSFVKEEPAGKVNLNTAGLEELMTLNGIGQAKAESILQYREKVGPFQRIEELKQVSGIGDAMFERVKEDIVVE